MDKYNCLPELNKLITNCGIKETKSLLDKIEQMRYMAYVISYLENDCCEITDVNSKYEQTYVNLSKTFAKLTRNSASGIDFKKVIEKLYNVIEHDTKALFFEKYDIFCERQSDFKEIDKDKAFSDVVINRWFEWSIIGGRRFYNEIENPTFIHYILDELFTLTSDAVAKNSVYVYDWGDFNVLFTDEKTMEDFINNFVETGIAFKYDDKQNIWYEMYSF